MYVMLEVMCPPESGGPEGDKLHHVSLAASYLDLCRCCRRLLGLVTSSLLRSIVRWHVEKGREVVADDTIDAPGPCEGRHEQQRAATPSILHGDDAATGVVLSHDLGV